MKYGSIADIYSANKKIREGLEIVLGGISPDEAVRSPDGGGWSIEQIVEHIALVGNGSARICAKLLDGAREMNKPADGTFALSESFRHAAELAAKTRLEAPARVQPSGSVSIAESLQNLAAASQTLEAMQPEMASLDLSQHTFPHPYFGDLTAAEWLVIAGAHELRHTLQIQQVLEQVRP